MTGPSQTQRLTGDLLQKINNALADVDPRVLEQVATAIYGETAPIVIGDPLAPRVAPPGVDAIARAVEAALREVLQPGHLDADA